MGDQTCGHSNSHHETSQLRQKALHLTQRNGRLLNVDRLAFCPICQRQPTEIHHRDCPACSGSKCLIVPMLG